MGGCAAFNCTNHSRKGFRMFRFPSNKERRTQWIINSRRSEWEPGPQAQLCSVHFDESQFEAHRADGQRKLKPFAVPTLFDVSNPPAAAVTDKRKNWFRCPKPNSLLEKMRNSKEKRDEEDISMTLENADICYSDRGSSASEPAVELEGDGDGVKNVVPHHAHKKIKISSSASVSPSYFADVMPPQTSTIISANGETEFDIWARSVAIQLNNMDLSRALRLQLQIQTLLAEERIAHECSRRDNSKHQIYLSSKDFLID